MFASSAYLKRLLEMREQGYGTNIKNIVMFDTEEESELLKQQAICQYNINVYTLD